jgi:hypothetical protein
MKTWAAGLAYSNGIRPRPADGRLVYYAERSPRLSRTLRFVTDELRRAAVDARLGDYAVAQAFGSRVPDSYEARALEHAEDLASGQTPELVRGFRERLLALRSRPDLARALFDRLEVVVGQVLPGYGPPAENVQGAVYLAIGPESQLADLEAYLHEVEHKDMAVVRIHPRDFWFPARF